MKRWVLVLLLLFVVTPPAYAFQNGSFEFGTVVGGFVTIGPGSDFISPWAVASGTIDVIGTYWTSADGAQSIDLNGNEAGTLAQTIPTRSGCTYRVTFALSGNSACGSADKTMDVYINGDSGNPVANFSTNRSAQGNNWEDVTFSFTADSPNTAVYFRSLTQGACGPAIDHVRVVEECPPSPSIPTLNEWGIIVFMAAACFAVLYQLRRKSAV